MADIIEHPGSGSHKLCFKGDVFEFLLETKRPLRGKAFVRTNIGRGAIRRKEIVDRVELKKAPPGQDWRGIRMMQKDDCLYSLRVALTEVGHFEAKCCFFPDGASEPLWPDGDNIHINVEPAEYCCANSIYCAFVRQFGPKKSNAFSEKATFLRDADLRRLDEADYAVIPPSGTFRDLIGELDHIIDDLNCRILHLLPINPTPTVYGRMGRYGSPYASLDFTGIDPALAEFDRKATPLDQFLELVGAVHRKNAKIFLDIAINHTGWASKIHEDHPEWLVRDKDGTIRSPGAWGVIWGDLTELDHKRLDLWSYLADMFIVWCERGVDGFRCDAGYMIPVEAWEYIIAKVRDEYPNAIFLLEGLGGDPKVTSRLLDYANMNWAYSELFQNYSREQVEGYVKYANTISASDGILVHYAETHDNMRLAATSERYAMMRTALCALCSSGGTFGFANGVEWFAKEKIDVHEARALNWGSEPNQVSFIARLNTILIAHPSFHNDSEAVFIDSGATEAVAFLRFDSNGENPLLIFVNLNCEKKTALKLKRSELPLKGEGGSLADLISGESFKFKSSSSQRLAFILAPGQVLCLSFSPDDCKAIKEAEDKNLIRPDKIDMQRAKAMALEAMCDKQQSCVVVCDDIDELAGKLLEGPFSFLENIYTGGEIPYVQWRWPEDLSRCVMIPPRHMLVVTAPHRFRASVMVGGRIIKTHDSLKDCDGNHFAIFGPAMNLRTHLEGEIRIAVFEEDNPHRDESALLFLSSSPQNYKTSFTVGNVRHADRLLYLSGNGRGGLTHLPVEWGALYSRYDALLLSNLSVDYPVDRHIMWRRCRMWVFYHGVAREFSLDSTESFHLQEDGFGVWNFHLPLGNSLSANISVKVKSVPGQNATRLQVVRAQMRNKQRYVRDREPVRIIIRPDMEDRNFHSETKAYAGPEKDWPGAVGVSARSVSFEPCEGRELYIRISKGRFVQGTEWNYSIYQQNEASRGLEANTDLFSPGYFEVSLCGGECVEIIGQIVTPLESEKVEFQPSSEILNLEEAPVIPTETLLLDSMKEYVVKRDELKTVIAGYPWFLDWGRDTLICARGLIAAGMLDDVRKILIQFAKFSENGTLPNIIHGNDVGNRDTSDAPLWLFVACDDFCKAEKSFDLMDAEVRPGVKMLQALIDLAQGYIDGTPNGIKMDPKSCLVYSPPHFTWMDTNYPAGTPRAGYPIEIQALWFAALKFLSCACEDSKWNDMAEKTRRSIRKYYWLPEKGYLSDCLHTEAPLGPDMALADDHLRPNQLFAITLLGALDDTNMKRSILRSVSRLLVPGAIRTLDNSKVSYPLPVKSSNGTILNMPDYPYWGRYEGDEDSRRKPAYHNGTAWTWPFPSYCEAYCMVYGENGKRTAKALLSSSKLLMENGCVGHLPEILDGDFPHKQRGCDAQAWGITEFFRIWKMLE